MEWNSNAAEGWAPSHNPLYSWINFTSSIQFLCPFRGGKEMEMKEELFAEREEEVCSASANHLFFFMKKEKIGGELACRGGLPPWGTACWFRSIGVHSFVSSIPLIPQINSLHSTLINCATFVCLLAPLLVELFVFVLFCGRSHWRPAAHNPPTREKTNSTIKLRNRREKWNRSN